VEVQLLEMNAAAAFYTEPTVADLGSTLTRPNTRMTTTQSENLYRLLVHPSTSLASLVDCGSRRSPRCYKKLKNRLGGG